MTEKIPPHREHHPSRKNLYEYSDLLAELAKIRKDIEQESLPPCHSSDLGQDHSKDQDNNNHNHSNITSDINKDDKSFQLNSFRRLYRFDLEHSGHDDLECLNIDSKNFGFSKTTKNDTIISLPEKELSYQSEFEKTNEKTNYFSKKQKRSEIKSNHYRFDDGPVLIPIHRPETRISRQNSNFPAEKVCGNHRQAQDGLEHSDVDNFTALSWGLISQYENENFANLSANAGNLSLLIGWGAIACGLLIFVRSFFVGSLIWLSYGLPVVALGAVCLFLGIILNILSDKMQHINDLKQSLTTHRILNPSANKIDPLPTFQNEHAELENVYDRLVKLRSEINELIDECENS